MENGQLSINQAVLEQMIQLKLAEAKASVVQSTMTRINALTTQAQADATNNSASAAANAVTGLGSYASALGTVAQEAIVAAGSVAAFNNAVNGALDAGVSQADIDSILSGMNTQLEMIDNVSANLSTNFGAIVSPNTSSDSSGSEEDPFQKEMEYWENLIGVNQKKYELIQNRIDLLEKQGKIAGEDYYEEQIRLEEERKSLLEQQQDAAKELLGTFSEGSDEWF
jgi:hypothetical protein